MLLTVIVCLLYVEGQGPPWGPPMNCGGSSVCYRGCIPGSIATKSVRYIPIFGLPPIYQYIYTSYLLNHYCIIFQPASLNPPSTSTRSSTRFQYCNHSLSIEARLDALANVLTFDEKVRAEDFFNIFFIRWNSLTVYHHPLRPLKAGLQDCMCSHTWLLHLSSLTRYCHNTCTYAHPQTCDALGDDHESAQARWKHSRRTSRIRV